MTIKFITIVILGIVNESKWCFNDFL